MARDATCVDECVRRVVPRSLVLAELAGLCRNPLELRKLALEFGAFENLDATFLKVSVGQLDGVELVAVLPRRRRYSWRSCRSSVCAEPSPQIPSGHPV